MVGDTRKSAASSTIPSSAFAVALTKVPSWMNKDFLMIHLVQRMNLEIEGISDIDADEEKAIVYCKTALGKSNVISESAICVLCTVSLQLIKSYLSALQFCNHSLYISNIVVCL